MEEKNKLILVEWHDHHSFRYNEWHDLDEFENHKAMEIVSIGWLIKETDHHLIIAAHWCMDQKRFTGEMMILKSTIYNRRDIIIPIGHEDR